MFVIVDMQNRILDEADECFVPSDAELIPKIKQSLDQARKENEIVIFTRDVPVEVKNKNEDQVALQIIPELAALSSELILKKYYYTLPPEQLVKVQKLPDVAGQKTIELAGAELNLCVLANALALQSAFPAADLVIGKERVIGKELSEEALALLRGFHVAVK